MNSYSEFSESKDFSQVDLSGLEQKAKQFATEKIKPGAIIYLQGDLGAGKTSFVRAVLKQLGYEGLVKSPTYSLIESYPLENFNLYHMDLYRLKDPSELEQLGLADYLSSPSVFLIEWPECGEGFLPEPTHVITFEHHPTDFLLRKINL